MPLSSELAFRDDIGMFCFDRPIPVSCNHKTTFCDTACYNVKFYRLHDLEPRDRRCEEIWQALTPETLADLQPTLDRKRRQTRRIRLMSRGEAFSDYRDIERVSNIATSTKTLLWTPTRAWRHQLLRPMVWTLQGAHANLRILASTDPTTTHEEFESLRLEGWSTMHFGSDSLAEKAFMCPKTHRHLKGHCAICRAGCFSRKQVHVHLAQH